MTDSKIISYWLGGRHFSSTIKTESVRYFNKKTGEEIKIIMIDCSEYEWKNLGRDSYNRIEAEGLGMFFEISSKGAAKAGKNHANKVAKIPARK